ncbi:hypothetical protein L6452_11637 [Arctium lappa]|uniref:Uncharacterized protein n=1 Tax=Arctium lappa TaxID=4217 RepID=A0ACB9DPN3_ARCLA|nr:hypothetical protein L6452_11637 [Arctium lappa]
MYKCLCWKFETYIFSCMSLTHSLTAYGIYFKYSSFCISLLTIDQLCLPYLLLRDRLLVSCADIGFEA